MIAGPNSSPLRCVVGGKFILCVPPSIGLRIFSLFQVVKRSAKSCRWSNPPRISDLESSGRVLGVTVEIEGVAGREGWANACGDILCPHLKYSWGYTYCTVYPHLWT